MTDVYLNGRFVPAEQAQVSVMDRGFLFADAVYEVIPAYGGIPFRLEQHLARLLRSLGRIHMAMPLSPAEWETIINRLLGQHAGMEHSVYLQVSRGAYPERNHAIPAEVQPTVFAMTMPMVPPKAEDLARGINIISLEDIRWDWCDIKCTALLANILLRQKAVDSGAQEAVLIRQGHVTEGTASNVFVVHDDVILTPPEDGEVLPGITRDLVIELAQENQLPYREALIPAELLHQAQEIWITSSSKEVMAATRLDGQPVGDGRPGPHWRRMHALYRQRVKQLVNH